MGRSQRRAFAVLVALSITGLIAGLGATAGAGAPTVPGAPRAVSAVPFGSGVAQVTWKAPASDGGSAILGYAITPYLGAVAQPAKSFAAKPTNVIVHGLQNGKTYQFVIAASNAVGPGAPSPKSAKMIVGVPLKPRAPFAIRYSGAGALEIVFKAPNDGGAKITSYTAKCTSSNGGKTGTKTGPPKNPGAGYVLVIRGLTHGKKYTCVVRGENSRGPGLFSPPSPARDA